MIGENVPVVVYDGRGRRIVGCTILQIPILNYLNTHGDPIEAEVAIRLTEAQHTLSENYIAECEITDPELIHKIFGDIHASRYSSQDQPTLDIDSGVK